MIHRLIELSLQYRWVVIVAAAVLAVTGGWCMVQTPMDAIPDLSEVQVIVFADWPGHAPPEIQNQITYPLAARLQGLRGVRVVRSSSDFGFSMIHVIFEDNVEIVTARKRVSEQLAEQRLDLPDGVVPYVAPEAPATGQIFWYVLEGRGYDLGKLRDLQDWHVKQQLATVPGVAEVASVGGFPVEYKITVDPRRLQVLGISLGRVLQELAAANLRIGGHVLQSPTAEYVVRATSLMGSSAAGTISAYENLVLSTADDRAVRLSDVARVSLGPGPRRGVLEQDGQEVVGGVVLMRYGENPLQVVELLREKVRRIQPSLPDNVRIVTSYDRTPLIHAAVETLSTALLEAMLTATICVLLVMRHFRTSLVISLTLPLSVLSCFLIMSVLRRLGIVHVDTNIMSLAGLVISIGVLVDSSIVMAENVMHTLHGRFGDRPVRGDVRRLILPACQSVGRPIFFSVLIMFLSFLPIFTLSGLEGKMFRPLALTKSFALAASAVLAITLVPALCSLLVRGRMRSEREVWIVRSLIDAYRPLLNFLLDRPVAMAWVMGVTFLVGLAPLGEHPQWLADLLGPLSGLGRRPAMLVALTLSLAAVWLLAHRRLTRIWMFASLVVIALISERVITPLSSEFLAPLDEQTVMDMPITVPRASISQSADDLKARDMVLCRFPEVEMVMGKVGRADTPTDPAPVDMIETMVSFRNENFWPRRKLKRSDAEQHLRRIYQHLVTNGFAEDAGANTDTVLHDSLEEVLGRFDMLMREYVYQRNQEHQRELARELGVTVVRTFGGHLRREGALDRPLTDGNVAALSASLPADALRQLAMSPSLEGIDELLRSVRAQIDRLKRNATSRPAAASLPLWFGRRDPAEVVLAEVRREYENLWRSHIRSVNQEVAERGTGTLVRLALEDLLARLSVSHAQLARELEELRAFRATRPKASGRSSHHGLPATEPLDLDPLPVLDGIQAHLVKDLAPRFDLWRKERVDLVGFGGELDRALQMPGWTNVWTMPIQNRVDMLATGVNTTIGIRVLGDDLDLVVAASEKVGETVKQINGAVDVVADPVRGKGYLSIRVAPERAAQAGISMSDAQTTLAVALGGVTTSVLAEGRERHAVRVVLPPDLCNDLEAIRRLPIASRRLRSPPSGQPELARSRSDAELTERTSSHVGSAVTLGEIADVEFTEGPATIKGENGLLRNYVRLNVRGRDPLDFVHEAQSVVAERVDLPAGVFLEWTGQFEHQQRARRTFAWVLPVVLLAIFGILYLTYRDLADALLMLLAVPGAVAGGLVAQWILGFKFSVTVWVGYIACFGMATSTGIIMLVYLRQAIERAGGLERMSLEQLRAAVLAGAVHRLRPKLLTEATTVIGLAPMLWATGVGAEVIRPMAAPVLGGILIADEVIDLFLPVMFYWVRRARWRRIHQSRSDTMSLSPEPALADAPAT